MTIEADSAPARRTTSGRERWRVGLIGAGKQALSDHVPALLSSDLADLVAVCDVNPLAVDQVLSRHSATGYDDFQEMLAREDLDFVVVAVPHAVGTDIVHEAVNRRVHVLKEKPFALNMAEARRLTAASEDAGVEIMTTLQRRFNPIYCSFAQLADQIGEPFFVDARYTIHTDDPAPGWRARQDTAGGGCIIDMGYHMVDMLIWYFGLPDRVFTESSARARRGAAYEVEDTAAIVFVYDSGLFGTLHLSRCIGPRGERIRVDAQHGAIVVERGRIQRLNPEGEVMESLARDGAWPTAAVNQVDHFCRVLAGQRANISGPRSQLAHAAFIESCYLSMASGTYVEPKKLIA